MLQATLVRAASTDQGTPGVLTFGANAVHTLELPWRNNAPQLSCIPPGNYLLRWQRSPKMGMCYHLQNVPGRANVLVHSANLAGDSTLGYITQLHGCIAPCMRYGTMRNAAGKMQFAGLVSRTALNLFNAFGSTAPITLEIS